MPAKLSGKGGYECVCNTSIMALNYVWPRDSETLVLFFYYSELAKNSGPGSQPAAVAMRENFRGNRPVKGVWPGDRSFSGGAITLGVGAAPIRCHGDCFLSLQDMAMGWGDQPLRSASMLPTFSTSLLIYLTWAVRTRFDCWALERRWGGCYRFGTGNANLFLKGTRIFFLRAHGRAFH